MNKKVGWTKWWIKRSVYSGSGIKFKTTMLKFSLCDYADAYILVKETITITGAKDAAAARKAGERNKGVIFKNYEPFIKCINKMNDTEVDNAQGIDIVMLIYNLIEYSDNYSKHLEVYGSTTKINQMTA